MCNIEPLNSARVAWFPQREHLHHPGSVRIHNQSSALSPAAISLSGDSVLKTQLKTYVLCPSPVSLLLEAVVEAIQAQPMSSGRMQEKGVCGAVTFGLWNHFPVLFFMADLGMRERGSAFC